MKGLWVWLLTVGLRKEAIRWHHFSLEEIADVFFFFSKRLYCIRAKAECGNIQCLANTATDCETAIQKYCHSHILSKADLLREVRLSNSLFWIKNNCYYFQREVEGSIFGVFTEQKWNFFKETFVSFQGCQSKLQWLEVNAVLHGGQTVMVTTDWLTETDCWLAVLQIGIKGTWLW